MSERRVIWWNDDYVPQFLEPATVQIFQFVGFGQSASDSLIAWRIWLRHDDFNRVSFFDKSHTRNSEKYVIIAALIEAVNQKALIEYTRYMCKCTSTYFKGYLFQVILLNMYIENIVAHYPYFAMNYNFLYCFSNQIFKRVAIVQIEQKRQKGLLKD